MSSGVTEPQGAQNDPPPLMWLIALTTMYALTCYTDKMKVVATCKGQTVRLWQNIHKSVYKVYGEVFLAVPGKLYIMAIVNILTEYQ